MEPTLVPETDEELLLRFSRGETPAFAELVRRYERELYGYLRRYVGDGQGGFAVEELLDVRFVPLLDGVAKEL